MVSTRQATWTPPAEFDEYQLVGPLGAGGMGQVYLARDVFLDRMVAIKFLLDGGQDAGLERFRIEARALARLQHPNVVVVHRIGEAAGYPYLVSEHIQGQSLAQIAKPLPWSQVLEIGIGLTRGLAVAHQRGVLHRDIKAANAMLAEDGSVKLLDFGLAKLSAGPPVSASTPPLDRPALDGPTLTDGPLSATRAGRKRDPTTDLQLARTGPADPRLALTRSAAVTPRSSDATEGDAAVGTPPDPTSLTQAGAMLGTPIYMPPEAWRGEPLTAASDVYSMGVVLFELCAGRTPFRGLGITQIAAVVASAEPPALLEYAPDVDPRLAAIIDRCRARDASARYPSAAELRDALEGLTTSARAGAIPEGNPYRGLQAFEAEHRALFFGRDRAIRDVVERLRGEAFVLIAGDSGAGKSSLCRAGVLPVIVDGALGGDRRWRVLQVGPGTHALGALMAAVAPALGLAEDALLAEVTRDPAALGRALRHAAGQHDAFVLFLDQLEELVTIAEPGDAELVAETLRQLAVMSPSVRLLATVRGDFLTRVAARFGRADEIMRAVHLLLPPGKDELRSAIVDPARCKGVTFESDALVEQLVEAGGRADGGLPLLQFALAQLWNARRPGELVIREGTLAAIGGVEGALARHADEVMARLLPAPRAAARRVLLRLVTALGTRTRRGEAELCDGVPDAGIAIDALVRGRLLVAREGDDGTAYEVAHEALVHGWDALRSWHEQSKDARAVVERVERAAADWHRVGRPAEGLWGDRQLAELAIVEEPLPADQAAFVAASRRTVRRRRWLWRGALIAVPLIIAVVWLGVRIANGVALDREIARREQDAAIHLDAGHALAARAANLRTGAFQLFDVGLTRFGELGWHEALALTGRASDELSAGSRTLEAALLVDASRVRLRRRLAALTYDRMILAESSHDPAQVEELLGRLELWDLDGAQRARWNAPAAVSLATSPVAVPIALERYVERGGRLVTETVDAPATTPVVGLALRPGSYRFTLDVAGTPIRYPVLLGRGEELTVDVPLPEPKGIPADFTYVPAGRFVFGYSGDEILRRSFLYSPPLHAVWTPAFLIARHETTFAEWLGFLDAVPADERGPLLPGVTGADAIFGSGGLEVTRTVDGRWKLVLQPTVRRFEILAGQPLVYPGRTSHAVNDWSRLPVTGISFHDVEAYVAWLSQTGKVPRARLCTAFEWQRAARGADSRLYPNGNALAFDDANFYETHRNPTLDSTGPDEVGAHPRSRSPFDVDDLSGNVWELVRPLDRVGGEVRGSAWYFDAFNAQVVNRQPMELLVRDILIGTRVCADP